MGLIDDKRNVINTIGAYTSLKQQTKVPNPTNQFTSINNSKDIVPYLLSVLSVVAGSFALKQLVGQLFTDFATSVEPELKTAIKKQMIQTNADEQLSTAPVKVKAKDIDYKGIYSSPIQSPIGDLQYGSQANSFDKQSYNAVSNPDTYVTYNNLSIRYNLIDDTFSYKPITYQSLGAASDNSIGSFLNNFIDDTTILDKKTFQVQVMNSIFGSITSSQEKTAEQVSQELMVGKMFEQLIDDDDDSFEVKPGDLNEIQKKAQDLVNGVLYYDMGCGYMATELSLDDLTDMINNTSNSTDPNAVSNQVTSALDKSLAGNPETSAQNKETIQDNFFQRLIKSMTLVLAEAAVAAPQIRALLAISSAFTNGGIPKISTIQDDLNNFKIYIKCIINKAMELINKFIYDIVVSFLIALITPVIKKVVKEKINQYKSTLMSLSPVKLTG